MAGEYAMYGALRIGWPSDKLGTPPGFRGFTHGADRRSGMQIDDDTPLNDILHLMSRRLRAVMQHFKTVGDVRKCDIYELMSTPNFGKNSLAELCRIIGPLSREATNHSPQRWIKFKAELDDACKENVRLKKIVTAMGYPPGYDISCHITAKRNALIIADRLAGRTYDAIALKHGISPGRVSQIIAAHCNRLVEFSKAIETSDGSGADGAASGD